MFMCLFPASYGIAQTALTVLQKKGPIVQHAASSSAEAGSGPTWGCPKGTVKQAFGEAIVQTRVANLVPVLNSRMALRDILMSRGKIVSPLSRDNF